jgi:hypothetical protein
MEVGIFCFKVLGMVQPVILFEKLVLWQLLVVFDLIFSLCRDNNNIPYFEDKLMRRDGREAEGARLLSEYTGKPVSRVRIPLSPPLYLPIFSPI